MRGSSDGDAAQFQRNRPVRFPGGLDSAEFRTPRQETPSSVSSTTEYRVYSSASAAKRTKHDVLFYAAVTFAFRGRVSANSRLPRRHDSGARSGGRGALRLKTNTAAPRVMYFVGLFLYAFLTT